MALQSASPRLCDHSTNHLSGNIRKAEIAAVETEGEAFVVEAEKVEQSGVEIVDADAVDGGLEADFIGLAMVDTTADPGTGEPVGERVGIVVAAGFTAFLGHGQTAEFAAPDHQGRVEQAALFEVFEQGGDGLVGFEGEAAVVADNVLVTIPTALVLHAAGVDLHKTDAAFDHAPGHEALSGEVGAVLLVEAVALAGGFRFAGNVESLGSGGLHAIGEFEAFQARGELALDGGGCGVFLVEQGE